MKDSTFIKRVILKNYKSIAACDVQLQPLTFLVGRNGSGKSNFLDALRFVADALNYSLEHAIRDRGGINDVCRRFTNPRHRGKHFSIRLEFVLPNGSTGYYSFKIEGSSTRYRVQSENCKINNENLSSPDIYFNVVNGEVTDTSVNVSPAAKSDRLYLVNASGLPEFRPIYDILSRMRFYNLNPDKIRELQTSDSGNILAQDGSNITSVFSQLSSMKQENIKEYLFVVVPEIQNVVVNKLDHMETLMFVRYGAENKRQVKFNAKSMSDGTLRALGILVALFQGNQEADEHVTLIGIEEPEIALHPAAAGVLLDALRDAAYKRQVLITSHSPDLLDDKHLDVNSILAVEAHNGNTLIAPIDKVGRSIMGDNLCTAGELLRLDQFQPDPTQIPKGLGPKVEQLNLFDYIKKDTDEKEKEGTLE